MRVGQAEQTPLLSKVHIETYMQKSTNPSNFLCKICSQQFKLKSVCESHIKRCLKSLNPAAFETDAGLNGGEEDSKEDQYWNYKNGEFLLDSIFALSTVFEDFGDGLGMFIISKLLLPMFHGLRHSNYSCSIHRMILRVNCLTSPKEALKIIHERFFNREGKPGKNIFKGN